ncbi:GcrA family cell cycle regulator [Leucobacter sp. HY1910]
MNDSAGRPDPKRAQLRKLQSEGLSVRKIAEQIGVSRSTVSAWAKQEGLSFDRSKTAQAVAAKSIDLAAGRQRLAEKMLAVAEDMLDRIDDPYVVYSFGGKDNTFEQATLDSAPVEVRRNIVTTAGITFDKLTRIVEKDTDLTGVTSVVQSLEAGILAAAEVLRTDTPTGGEEEGA